MTPNTSNAKGSYQTSYRIPVFERDSEIDFQKLWRDGRFFAQLSLGVPGDPQVQAQSDGSLAGDVLSVARDLVGTAYQLGTIPSPFEPTENLEVYEALTYILPTLSEQSAFFWERAARPLASQLVTARYPIRAQASHLIFWWARLGGLMGPTTRRGAGQELSLTSDASNVEFSWAIPPTSNRKEKSNPRVRFSIDPFHPERGHRMAGGAFINYLCSAEGGMGLVKSEPGCTLWKEIIEKWLFPDIKSTEEFVQGSAYGVAFDLEPSGAINLKGYYVPPLPPSVGPNPQTRVTSYRGRPISPELMLRLTKDLHPSLEAPMNTLFDFLYSLDLDVRKGMVLHMISYDLTRPEKNRLKIYLKAERTKLKDMVYDMTLGGRIAGPKIDDAMANFTQFMKRMFPYMENDDVDLRILDTPERSELHMMYYYEFFIGESLPCSKVYFFMERLSKNDYEIACSMERFLKDIGYRGTEDWMVDALAHALPHRPLSKRNGIHTMISFGTKPKGWDVTNYYSPEIYAPEREVRHIERLRDLLFRIRKSLFTVFDLRLYFHF